MSNMHATAIYLTALAMMRDAQNHFDLTIDYEPGYKRIEHRNQRQLRKAKKRKG